MLRKRADWSRSLPRPLIIPEVITLSTLADVRELMRHLPAQTREKDTWRHIAAMLDLAARGDREVKGGDRKSKSRQVTLIPNLSSLGVTRTQSSRWQKLAARRALQFIAARGSPLLATAFYR